MSMMTDGKYTYAGVGVGLSFGILFFLIFDWGVALTGAFAGSLSYLLGLHFGQDREKQLAEKAEADEDSPADSE